MSKLQDRERESMTAIKKRLRIGVIFGGRSGEHEVSLASAASVIRALDPEKYEAVPIGISKDGRWLVGSGAVKMLSDVLKSGDRVMLPADPTAAQLVPVGASTGQPSVLVDVVFPVLHGTFGEDGTVQGLLELAGLPYVGAGVLASAVGMDKDVQKRLFEQAGLPIVPFLAIHRWQWERDRLKVLREIKKKFAFPDLREARNARIVSGHDARKRAARTAKGDGLGRRIWIENHRRARSQRPRNRSFSAGQRRDSRVDPRRNRPAPRILRLRG